MALDRFEKGEVVKVRGEFRTPKTALVNPNALIDPDIVTLVVRNPDKTVVTHQYGVGPAITRDATGKYWASIALTQEGTYRWRWTGDSGGDATGVSSGVFDSVQEPNF
jgi:hypothetical protein